MRYGNFPRLARWLAFESYQDYLDYKESPRPKPRWPLHFEERRARFQSLIDKQAAEPAIQTFLEANPYLLPGFGDLHHGPYEGIIASKLPLGRSFVTDFAYVASNSQTLYFTCVEIESARKRLFRSDGKFNRDYFDARQQIADWLLWASQNAREAIDCWGSLFNGRPASWYKIAFRGFLVFGRRSELSTRTRQERWSAEAASLHPGLTTMTYDRLLNGPLYVVPDVDNHQLAVCSYRDRRFIVKKVIC
jgi:hypothetical protein